MKIRGKINTLFIVTLSIMVLLLSIITSIYLMAQSNKEVRSIKDSEMSRIKSEINNYVDIAYETINSEYQASQDNDNLKEIYGKELRNSVDIAVSQINKWVDLANNGEIPIDIAKQNAAATVKNMRYSNGKGYIWINDEAKPFPKMVMHPIAPQLDGKELNAEKYNCALGNNTNLFSAMRDICIKNGEGFVDYIWPKPGFDKPVGKLSYVKEIKQWGWVVGTGIYIDDAKAEAIEKIKTQISRMRYNDGLGYFWINDISKPFPKMVMHPIAPQLNNKELNADKYNCALGNNTNLFSAMRDISLSDKEGFVDYLWPKPKSKERVAKLSYVKYFEPLGWVIGTGVYLDEVDEAVNSLITKERNKIRALLFIIIFSVTIIALIAAFVFYKKLTSLIITPLQATVNAANLISLGDLEITLDSNREDEIGELNSSFNKMIIELNKKVSIADLMAKGNLTEIIKPTSDRDILGISLKKMTENLLGIVAGIQSTASVVDTNSENLITRSSQLSDGASQQAAAIEEITSTTAEISSQASQNLDNSKKAGVLYSNIKSGLEISNSELEEMMLAMDNIEVSSKKISSIIKTVDDIAFQTNLLALNAAVEAARAGQHGKGFAVVADEVRNLAGRSAKAATETTELIDSAIAAIHKGKIISEKSVLSINKMGKDILETEIIIKEMEESSEEQSTGVTQINVGLDQINNVAERTIVNVDDTMNMSNNLSIHAKELVDILNKFTVDAELACVVTASEEATPNLIIKKVREFACELETHGESAFNKLTVPGSDFIFGGTYIAVQDKNSIMLAHPVKPNLNGKDLSTTQDIKGKYIFKEMSQVATRSGEGWVSYYWPKPGESEPSLKTTFVKQVNHGGKIYVVLCGNFGIDPKNSNQRLLS